MARTPSMSPEEAESALGTRGSLFVTADNHKLARKWLTAMGVPGLYAAGLARAAIADIYNDTSNNELDRAKAKAQEAKDESKDDTGDDSGESSVTQTAPVTTTTTTAPNQDAQIQRIATLLGEMLAKPGCDPDMVRAIVNEKWAELPDLIAKYSNTVTVELKRHDGTTYKVDGHTHPKFLTLVEAMNSRMANGRHPNIMLVGPTGSGKTHAVEEAAKALGRDFFSNGAISMDHQLIGFVDAGGHYHETALREAFGKPAVYLFDEIDSSDNSPLLCLAGALANGGFRFPDTFVHRHPDSIIIAAGNTWGLGASSDFVGRNKLDGAIRSRFPIRIHWDYDESLERAISGNVDWACRVQKARSAARRAGLKVIIDPRMTQAGAGLIASGMSFDDAAKLTYLADLSKEQAAIIEAN